MKQPPYTVQTERRYEIRVKERLNLSWPAVVVGLGAGVAVSALLQIGSDFLANRNIDPAYVQPKTVIVATTDRDSDGKRETMLKVKRDGATTEIPLTGETIDRLVRDYRHSPQ